MWGRRAGVAWVVVVAVALGIGCGARDVPGADGSTADARTADAPAAVTVVGVAVTPPSATLCAGATQAFAASLRLSDGTTRAPAAGEVTWSSSMPAVATIDASGVAVGIGNASGVTTITAAVGVGAARVTGTAALTAPSCNSLDAIVIGPATATVAPGQPRVFLASGHFTSGASSDVTSMVQWTSSMPAVATIDAQGVAHGVAPGVTTIRAAMGTVTSNAATLTVSAFPLVAISLSPVTATLAAGSTETAALVASGRYADGTARDVTAMAAWVSSAPTIASVSTATSPRGVVSPSASMTGMASVTAVLDGVTSSAAVITVVPSAVVRAIAVTPSPLTFGSGETRNLVATATYLDGHSADVTAMAAWSSSAPATADVGPATGVVRGVGCGAVTLTATIGTVSGSTMATITCDGLVSIELSPLVATVAVGDRQAFTATGTLMDGSSRPLVAGVTWTSTRPAVATIDASGVATAVAAGTTTIRAQVGLVTATATLTVSTAEPLTLSITEAAVLVPLATAHQLRAIATYSDGTSRDVTGSVAWTSAIPAVVSVAPSGLLTAAAPGGPVTVTAAMPSPGGALTATVAVTSATAVIVRIDLSPAAPTSLPLGAPRAFTATAVYVDGSTHDVTATPELTWSSSNPAVASIAAGLVRGLTAGTTQISATYSDASGLTVAATPTPLTVTAARLTAIVADCGPAGPEFGVDQPCTAIGVYSDGSRIDLTQDATLVWASSNPSVARFVTTTPLGRGVLTAVAIGTSTVTATVGAGATAIVGSAVAQVRLPLLVRLTLTPASADIAIGSPGQRFRITANYSSGVTLPFYDTRSVLFSTSDPRRIRFDGDVASAVSGATPATGITITADVFGASGTATVNLTPAPTP